MQHLASICFRKARVRYVSWLCRATPSPESRLLPSAVPDSVLLVMTLVAPASVSSAACLRVWMHDKHSCKDDLTEDRQVRSGVQQLKVLLTVQCPVRQWALWIYLIPHVISRAMNTVTRYRNRLLGTGLAQKLETEQRGCCQSVRPVSCSARKVS